jgi:hypothetical protein
LTPLNLKIISWALKKITGTCLTLDADSLITFYWEITMATPPYRKQLDYQIDTLIIASFGESHSKGNWL